ncbi:MAG: glutathione S-transferase N-terminal domain-containing protein [Kangiellaceae bacterium]|nr:glutathione S-transferase N-terminal domain-containing protein [Kangiellaceae bacterium]
MQLIYSTASPYARTARIVVRELSLLNQVEEVFQHPFENPELLITANPLCKVPCLVVDGNGLFDSQVICEYLDSLAGDKLFAEISKNWQLKTLYSLTRGILDSCVAWQQDKMRDQSQRSEFWQQRFISSIERGLEHFAGRLDELPKGFSALHINLVTALEYLSFRHSEYQWQQKHPQLIDWYQKYKSRTSITDTAPE